MTAPNVLPVDPRRPEPDRVARAASILRAGGLVAFPTETVYGLGAHALDAAAVRRIFEAKGRPGYNPLIVHAPDSGVARALAGAWPAAAARLAAAFWPGPLTLVLPRAVGVPDAVTAGLETVALRVPAHAVALALLRAAGIPVAAPSANRSTAVSPTTAEHVSRSLGERVELILDGGPCPVGIESTVLSLVAPVPTILRPGTVTREQIEEEVGEVAVAGPGTAGPDEARPSPGMLDRHYAPEAEVVLFPAIERGARLAEAASRAAEGAPVGVVLMDVGRTGAGPEGVHRVAMPVDPGAYAARLYAVLHDLDARGVGAIYVEEPPDTPRWAGVRDRLLRAAHAGG